MIARALAVVILLVASPSLAETDPPPPSLVRCDRAHLVREGDRVPCVGLLVPADEGILAATCVHVDLPQCERRRDDEQRRARLEIETMHALVERAAAAQAATAKLLEEALALQREGPPWYEEPAFVVPVSVILTLAAVMAILYAYDEI